MSKRKRIEYILQAERKALCREAPLFADRLLRAGLYVTAKRMDRVVKAIGYEAAGEDVPDAE